MVNQMMTIDQALAYLDAQAKEARVVAENVQRRDRYKYWAATAVALALEETAEVIRGEVKVEGEQNG